MEAKSSAARNEFAGGLICVAIAVLMAMIGDPTTAGLNAKPNSNVESAEVTPFELPAPSHAIVPIEALLQRDGNGNIAWPTYSCHGDDIRDHEMLQLFGNASVVTSYRLGEHRAMGRTCVKSVTTTFQVHGLGMQSGSMFLVRHIETEVMEASTESGVCPDLEGQPSAYSVFRRSRRDYAPHQHPPHLTDGQPAAAAAADGGRNNALKKQRHKSLFSSTMTLLSPERGYQADVTQDKSQLDCGHWSLDKLML